MDFTALIESENLVLDAGEFKMVNLADLLFIKSPMLELFDFEKQERKYPVDLKSTLDQSIALRIEFPEEYRFRTVLDDLDFENEIGAIKVKNTVAGNRYLCSISVRLKKAWIEAEEYPALLALKDVLIKLRKKSVLIEKKMENDLEEERA
jgi:hypothetical protein